MRTEASSVARGSGAGRGTSWKGHHHVDIFGKWATPNKWAEKWADAIPLPSHLPASLKCSEIARRADLDREDLALDGHRAAREVLVQQAPAEEQHLETNGERGSPDH